MDDTLKYYEEIALSDKNIIDLLRGRVNIVLYPNLHTYDSIDQVLGPHGACVLLFEAKQNYGHWCAIIKLDANTIEFFNPYGGYPDDSLQYIPYHFAEVSNQLVPYLSILLDKSPYNLTYNEFQFQKKAPHIRTCGRHCVFRIINRDFSLYEYYELLNDLCSKLGTDYDGVVTIFTI